MNTIAETVNWCIFEMGLYKLPGYFFDPTFYEFDHWWVQNR